jgi:hypothetical protein
VESYDGLTDVLSEARRTTVRSRECLAIDAVIRGSGDERCRPR